MGFHHCPKCGTPIVRQTASQIVEHIKAMEEGRRIMLLAPVCKGAKVMKPFLKIKRMVLCVYV